MAAERLSRAAVAERALRLGDEEGVEAITIRRLATELGVTPMALYWHFKNKDELLLGIANHALDQVRADRSADDPWPVQLRAMLVALVGVMRAHPCLSDLLHSVDKSRADSFSRATEDALRLLSAAGFTVEEGYWVATMLLHGAMGLLQGQPDCPAILPPGEVAEWRRQRRLELERLPVDKFPMLVEYGSHFTDEPDTERYFQFGVEMLIAGVQSMAASKAAGPAGSASSLAATSG